MIKERENTQREAELPS